MTRLAAARKLAANLANAQSRPFFIWIATDGSDRCFVLRAEQKAPIPATILERVLPSKTEEVIANLSAIC